MADSSEGGEYEKGTLYLVPLDELQADPNQPRKIVDEEGQADLNASVARRGILQSIIFKVDEQGNKIVVAGERRVIAARLAGLTTIPALYVAGDYTEIALVENMLRQDLTAVEEAEGLQVLMAEKDYSQEQLATVVGKARTSICELLSINRLPQEIRDDCRGDRSILRGSLIAIAKKKQARAMITAYKALKAKLQKGKASRQKIDHNDPEVGFYTLVKAVTTIKAIDPTLWADADKAKLHSSLAVLKAEIDQCMQNPPPSA